MPHIPSFIKSLKLTWIRRLLQNEPSWLNLFHESTSCTITSLCNLGRQYILEKSQLIRNLFWKDVMHTLYNFITLLPKSTPNILRSPIWHNPEIIIDKHTIQYGFWIEKGIRTIQDLFNYKGDFLSLYEFEQRFGFKPPFTILQGLKMAILSSWPELRNISCICDAPIRPPYIDYICKNNKGSRDMYDLFIEHFYKKPMSEQKWEHELNLEQNHNWQKTNTIMRKCTKDTFIIWFQYRLLQRILPTKKYLYYMKIKNDPICNLCGLEIDTYSHAFFNCNIVYAFWKNIEEWIYEKTNVQLQLTISDIILGRSG